MHLPEFYCLRPVYEIIIDLYENQRLAFNPEMVIGSIYGCFPGCIWNGGRVINGSCSLKAVSKTIEYYNYHNIPLRFTFTNSLLNGEMMNDPFCNMVMGEADNGLNQVLVNASVLESYLRENYPSYKFISSTTKCLNNLEELEKEFQKDYSLIVVDYSFNNTEKLKMIPDKMRSEILLNAYCFDNCERRFEHYRAVSYDQIYGTEDTFGNCDSLCRGFYDLFSNRSFITVDEIYNTYYPLGFRHFKIEGRGNNVFDVIESLLYYLIVPKKTR